MTTATVKQLKELRVECDELGIVWHPRAKAESLQEKIDAVIGDPEGEPADDCQTMIGKNTDYSKNPKGDPQRVRALEALDHFGHVNISQASAIREYLQLLEAKAGIEH